MLARDYVLADGEEFWAVYIEYSSDAEPSGYGQATYWFVPAFSAEQAVLTVQGLWREDVIAGKYGDWCGEIRVTGVQREGHGCQDFKGGAAIDSDAWCPTDSDARTLHRLLGKVPATGSMEGMTVIDECPPATTEADRANMVVSALDDDAFDPSDTRDW